MVDLLLQTPPLEGNRRAALASCARLQPFSERPISTYLNTITPHPKEAPMAVVDALATVLCPRARITVASRFRGSTVIPARCRPCVTIALQTPPVAACTFTVEVASTQGGSYAEIGRLVWPAATSGSKQVPLGVSASRAQQLNNPAPGYASASPRLGH